VGPGRAAEAAAPDAGGAGQSFADAALTAEIRRLDQALYGGGEQSLGTAALYELAARLTKQGAPQRGSGDPYALRSLY